MAENRNVPKVPKTPQGPADESFVGRVKAWLSKTFPGNERAVLFGAAGFLIAIFVFVIGPWRTLVIALFVVAGVALAQYLDGDPKILKWIHRMLTNWRH